MLVSFISSFTNRPIDLISHSVYNNSLSINKNYNLDGTLQLLLTSEVVKSNVENEVPFSSNINVTNIDNFVRPQVDDKSDNHIERLLLLLFADIQINNKGFHFFYCIIYIQRNAG